ncbi:MAG: hypothetical protein ACU843_05015 [Gammaproteobacteria bacterium]
MPGRSKCISWGKRFFERVLYGVVGLISSCLCLAVEGTAISDPLPSFEEANPWSLNLMLYMWLPGINGDFSAGRINRSVDENFIGIVDASHRFPLGFMGRGEVRYERLGLFVDGVWNDLDLKPKTGPGGFASIALKTQLGIMDYGVMYRLFGPADRINRQTWAERSYRLDLYVGARTIWLENTVVPQRLPSVTASKSFTVPLIGGRVLVDFSREWFIKIDGNAGGFGADTVDFTGGVLGSVGYRADLFEVPVSIELGYKALFVNVRNQSVETDATLNGPFAGVTAYW